jgi:hypothetical protein
MSKFLCNIFFIKKFPFYVSDNKAKKVNLKALVPQCEEIEWREGKWLIQSRSHL